MAAHDQVSALDPEINGDNDDEEDNLRYSISSTTQSTDKGIDSVPKNAFDLILQKSSLAKSMKDVFGELSNSGNLFFYYTSLRSICFFFQQAHH